MAFTTQIFTFLFFPIAMLLYGICAFLQNKSPISKFLSKIRLTDVLLIVFGCVFYRWASFDHLFKLLFYIAIVFIFGWLIQKAKNGGETSREKLTKTEKRRLNEKITFIFSIIFTVLVLIYYKYTDLLIDGFNSLFNGNLEEKKILAPLGISFITFSAISYLADIYTGKAKAGDLTDCLVYLTFFPKIVSGPIVLWQDFSGQIKERTITVDGVSDGVTRIMIGFIKKLILADTFGACIAGQLALIDSFSSFGFGVLYMLQIYYDFSGYSDIAIGICKIFGFSTDENFNFPYLSCSITEFWRRWHISLGKWFKEYIYFPLGGSRQGLVKSLINISIVFALTGIWHGAGVTFALWGMINGLCNIIEKLLKNNAIYNKTPKIIKWALTMTVVFFCWQLFRFDSFEKFSAWFNLSFKIEEVKAVHYTWRYYFDNRIITFAIIGFLGSTVFGLPKVQQVYQKIVTTKWGYAVNQVVIILLFVISITFMVNSKYSPFLYFQY